MAKKKSSVLYIISKPAPGIVDAVYGQIYLNHEKLFSEDDLFKFEKRAHLEDQIKRAGIKDLVEFIGQETTLEQLADHRPLDLDEFVEWLVEKKGFVRVNPKKVSLYIDRIVEYTID